MTSYKLYSFVKQIFSKVIYHVPGILVGTGNSWVNRTDGGPAIMELIEFT